MPSGGSAVGRLPGSGRLEPVEVAGSLPPDPHGRVPLVDRDDGGTADPVVRARERIRVRAGRGERQQVAALDVGRERDGVGEHVTGLAVAPHDGHRLRDRSARARRQRDGVPGVVEHRPDVVRHPPVDGDHGSAVAQRSPVAHPVQADPGVPDDAPAGFGRERGHRETQLATRHPQAPLGGGGDVRDGRRPLVGVRDGEPTTHVQHLDRDAVVLAQPRRQRHQHVQLAHERFRGGDLRADVRVETEEADVRERGGGGDRRGRVGRRHAERRRLVAGGDGFVRVDPDAGVHAEEERLHDAGRPRERVDPSDLVQRRRRSAAPRAPGSPAPTRRRTCCARGARSGRARPRRACTRRPRRRSPRAGRALRPRPAGASRARRTPSRRRTSSGTRASPSGAGRPDPIDRTPATACRSARPAPRRSAPRSTCRRLGTTRSRARGSGRRPRRHLPPERRSRPTPSAQPSTRSMASGADTPSSPSRFAMTCFVPEASHRRACVSASSSETTRHSA